MKTASYRIAGMDCAEEIATLKSVLVPVEGVGELQFDLLNGKLTVSEALPIGLQNRPDLIDGDGTVPQVSAIPIELSNSLKNNFIAEKHGALQNQKQVLEIVQLIL